MAIMLNENKINSMQGCTLTNELRMPETEKTD